LLDILAQVRYFVANRCDSLINRIESLFDVFSQLSYAVDNRIDPFQHRIRGAMPDIRDKSIDAPMRMCNTFTSANVFINGVSAPCRVIAGN
jgi:hypothetical protein